MPPKKEAKKDAKASAVKPGEEHLPPGYDPETHQHILKFTELW